MELERDDIFHTLCNIDLGKNMTKFGMFQVFISLDPSRSCMCPRWAVFFETNDHFKALRKSKLLIPVHI